MILDQVTILDCAIFLIILAPQLIIQVGFCATVSWGLQALPFLLIKLPWKLLFERYALPSTKKTNFVRHSSLFQDIVIRCCRYAFMNMPLPIGRTFLSCEVSRPFILWRRWRHGLDHSQPPWEDVDDQELGVKGVWIQDGQEDPDIIIYYLHGGGFAMGSVYFYLEFCCAFVDLLKRAGFKSPALFAVEYTLVPNAHFPTQVEETVLGYNYILKRAQSTNIALSGDSAGGTLALSLLLRLTEKDNMRKPILVTLISPWCYILSDINTRNDNDYIDPLALHAYGNAYLKGKTVGLYDPSASPGHCQDVVKWRLASPRMGWYFYYGSDEVLAAGARSMVKFLVDNQVRDVYYLEERNEIHAWPIARMFLCSSIEERVMGLSKIVNFVRIRVQSDKA